MNPWSRRTRNVEAHACQVDRWPAEREGPGSELGTFKTGYSLKEIAKNWGKKQKKQKKSKTNAKKKQNTWVLGRVIPWEMGPRFPEKQRLGLGRGGWANHRPFPENLCAHSSVDAGTETQTQIKLILAHIACEANSRTGMHESQATESANPARPLNVNQAGVQKHFWHLRFWTYRVSFIFYFYLFCIAFLHLHFLCICDSFFLHFLSAVAFCLHFLDPFVCITCCIFSIFQFSKISLQGADTRVVMAFVCFLVLLKAH